jgi:KUP system potassium uptake protein
VVPISLGILCGLFLIQRRGTGAVWWLFAPVLLVWFGCLGVLGASEVVKHPGVLQALSPTWGARFMIDHGVAAFLTLGGVVLAVTGAEALYADRGHFGAWPIRFSWLVLVFPALVLNYLGQGALILQHPRDIANPFLLLVPHGLQLPMVLLATVATIIASQAVITGSYSVARQAVQLGFLPRLKILHTSKVEGQIYVPVVNWILAIGVIALVVAFRSSNRLADMYGVAVTGTFVLNTILFLVIARSLWKLSWWKVAPLGALFLVVELAFFTSNLAKIAHGAWLPLVVGIVISVVMISWRRGQVAVTRSRTAHEGSLQEFLARLCRGEPAVQRVPGTAVFLSPGKETTPLALRAQVDHSGVLQDRVVIVTLDDVGIPHVDPRDAFGVLVLGSGRFKVTHLTVRVGYSDEPDVPAALALARKRGVLERSLDLEHASYFLSRIHIVPSGDHNLSGWRKRLFVKMARNAASPVDHFALPGDRTVEVGSQISL